MDLKVFKLKSKLKQIKNEKIKKSHKKKEEKIKS